MIDMIFQFLSEVLDALVDLVDTFVDKFLEFLDIIADIFVNVPLLVSKFGVLVDQNLWMLPQGVKNMIYAAVFGVLLFCLVKLFLKIFKRK